MAPRAKLPWLTLASLMLVMGVAGGFLVWLFSVQGLDQEIERKRSALKRLRVGGHPPDHHLLDYLDTWPALQRRYQSVLAFVAPVPSVIEAQADPQLHFQQRFHEVQRTLERLAAARGMTAPVQLGVPKELPPADVVPRFLMQIGLIEEAAELLMKSQGVSQLVSFKIEDPQPVATIGDAKDSFVTRLPVRVRLDCFLAGLTKILSMLDRAKPMMDLQGLRVTVPASPQPQGTQSPVSSKAQDSKILEVELVLARYLIAPPQLEPLEEEPEQAPTGEKTKKKDEKA